MNAGMYGMADGWGLASRKVVGYVGKTTTGAITNALRAAEALGSVAVSTATVTAGVRTLLASVNARGAVLLAVAGHGSAVSSTVTVELVIDGETLLSRSYTSSANNDGIFAAGYGAFNSGDATPVAIQCAFDYVPFDGRAELWITTSGTLTTVKYSFLAELYK